MALTAKLPCDLSNGRICELFGKKHGYRPRQRYDSLSAVEGYLLQRQIEEFCYRDLYLFDCDLHVVALPERNTTIPTGKRARLLLQQNVTYPYLS
jgi:hypothetical protein